MTQAGIPNQAGLAFTNSPAGGGRPIWALITILVLAVALGGGGSKYGISNLIVQLAALAALSFHQRGFFAFWRTAPIILRVLTALSVIVPLLYIIPLPSPVWSALPGRELMVQSFELIGGKEWATASVDPIRTLLAVTALITPMAILTIGWTASRDQLITVGWIVVALGLINFLMGIPQALSTGQEWLLYPENLMRGVLFGSFANRNSAGLFLVGTLALAATLPAPARFAHAALAGRITICTLLFVAVILTRSRTALILAIIPIALAVLQAILWQIRRNSSAAVRGPRSALLLIAPIVVVVVLAGTVVVAAPGRVNDVLERFNEGEDARSYMWEDAAYSAKRYWPVGSGTGTFDDVFQIDESLENMTLRRAGRAHNDYLEVAIEAGLPGLALLAGWLASIVWFTWKARTSPQRWIAWSGGVILLTIALQSITDYPLRNVSMLAFGGYALLILVRFSAPIHTNSSQETVL